MELKAYLSQPVRVTLNAAGREALRPRWGQEPEIELDFDNQATMPLWLLMSKFGGAVGHYKDSTSPFIGDQIVFDVELSETVTDQLVTAGRLKEMEYQAAVTKESAIKTAEYATETIQAIETEFAPMGHKAVLSVLKVVTLAGEDVYYGEDAIAVKEELFAAELRNATTTTPIKLGDGMEEVKYRMAHIVSTKKEYGWEPSR